MVAIPVPSSSAPTNPLQPLVTDQIKDNDRRVTVLERSASLAALEARITAIEIFLGI